MIECSGEGSQMSENKAQEFMKKHPPWFTLDIHPIRFSKKLSEEEREDNRETAAVERNE
jgi:hypothetical protein